MAKNDNLIVVKNDGSVISTTSSGGTGSYIAVTTGNGTTTTINKDNYITVVNGNGTTTTVYKDEFGTQPVSGGSATTQALINAATSGSSTSGGITTVTVDKDDFNTQPISGGTAATINDLIDGLTATQEKTFALSKVFEIYISGYNSNGSIVSKETLLQKIPAESENGLRLINPVVKNEMGVAESFDFSIEPGTKFYDAFLQMKTYLRVVYDGTTIFYGRVITIDSNSFRGTRKIRCEGPLAFLLDSPVEGVEEKKRKEISIYDYLKQLIDNHNSYINQDANKKFYLGEVPGHYSSSVTSEQQITDSKKKKYGSDSWTDTKSAIEDLRSHYGGYLRTRLSDKIGSGIYLDWLDCYFNSTVNTQTVEVGKNILDISSVTELENIFTAIIPIGKKTVRKENSSGSTSSEQTNLYLKGKILKVPDITSHYSKAELNFGYHKYEDYANAINNYGLIFKTVNFSDADTEDKLKNEACEWIKNNYQGEVMKFTIKAVDMRQIGQNVRKIMVGDRVKISYRVGNEAGKFTTKTTTQTCISISFDLYHPENNSYTFGVPANILTKTYGVTKQATSVANNSSNPPTPDTPGGGAPERSWFEYASGWLMRHKEHFSLYPPTRYTDEMGTAGQSSSDLYLYEPGPSVLNPAAPKHSIAKSIRRIYYIANGSTSTTPQHIDNAKISDVEANGNTVVRLEYLEPTRFYITGALTEQLIYDCYVCEWVKQEYGYDLRSELPVPGSQATTTSNGETTVFDQVPNPETGVPEYVTIGFDGAHVTTSFGPNGETIVSMQDENGDWHYYYKDAKGKITETSIRDLKLEAISTDKYIGSMVTSGYFDKNGKPVMYKFGQGIEEWANGEMVVATVEGDVVRIGNEHTQWSTTVAQKINGSFLGCTEYIVDPVTGEKAAIKIGSTGQVSYKARWDENLRCYVYDEKGNVEITGDGIWDTSNLAFQGGIMTVSDPNTGVKTTYIDASRIVIGGVGTDHDVISKLQEAGVLDGDADPQALVAKKIYTEDINALKVRCQKIETDYLKADLLESKIGTMSILNVRNIKGINTKDNESTATFKNYFGDHYYIQYATGPNTTDTIDLKQSIAHISITKDTDTNTYTLHMYNAMNSELDPREGDALTFSSAVTSFSYSGPSNGDDENKYVITPNPQKKPNFEFYPQAPIDYVPTLLKKVDGSVNEKIVVAHIEIMTPVQGSQPVKIGTSYININTTKSWEKGEASGKNTGWRAANDAVVPPSENTSTAYFDFYVPSETVGTSSSYRYTISSDNTYTYAKNAVGTTVARIASKYGDGWRAANNVVVPPSKNTSTAYFDFNVPSETVGTSSSYRYTISSDNTYTYAKNAVGTIVARIASKYGDGWSAAYGKCSNAAAGTGTTFNVKIPASTTGQQSEYDFTLSIDNSYAYVQNSLSKTVARIDVPAPTIGNSLTYHNSSWNTSGSTYIKMLNPAAIWSDKDLAEKYGYLSFTINSKKYYLSFDNRKGTSSGTGNTAYYAGYKDGRNSLKIASITVEENKTYNASAYSVDGWNEVTVKVPGEKHTNSIELTYTNKYLGADVYEHKFTYTTVAPGSSNPLGTTKVYY